MRTKAVATLEELDQYPYSGHSLVLGICKNDWQDTQGVLRLFAARASNARRRYRGFVEKGIALGKREELSGGGLIRSSGGWTSVKAQRRLKQFQKSDERILGDGEFVHQVLAGAREQMQRKYRLQEQGVDLGCPLYFSERLNGLYRCHNRIFRLFGFSALRGPGS